MKIMPARWRRTKLRSCHTLRSLTTLHTHFDVFKGMSKRQKEILVERMADCMEADGDEAQEIEAAKQLALWFQIAWINAFKNARDAGKFDDNARVRRIAYSIAYSGDFRISAWRLKMAWTAENDLYLETHHNLFTRVVEQIATLEFFTTTGRRISPRIGSGISPSIRTPGLRFMRR